MKILFTFLLAVSLNAQTQTTVNGRKAYSGAVNAQTSTYQALVSDFNAPCGTIPVASGTFTITLVASGTQPPAGQCVDVINYGSGVVTIARSGQNINGGTASLTLAAGSASAPTGVHIVSDGTNYEAQTFGAAGGASIATPAALSSIPGTCTVNGSNAFFQATDAPYKAICTASNTYTYFLDGFGQATPLATGNFTAVNLSSAVALNNGGIINLNDTENNGQFHGYCASYTTTQVIDIPIDYVIQGTNFPGVVVGFSDGTKYEHIVLLGQGGAPLTYIVQLWATAGSSPSNVNSGVTVGAAKIKALRITDNNTNKIFSYSPDGKNFTQILSETRTTNLTASQYCFGLATNAGSFVNGSFLGVYIH